MQPNSDGSAVGVHSSLISRRQTGNCSVFFINGGFFDAIQVKRTIGF